MLKEIINIPLESIDFLDYSLKDINNITEPSIREYFINEYKSQISELANNSFSKRIINNYISDGLSINDLSEIIETETLANTSLSLFPNKIVLFYPHFKFPKASTYLACDICGSLIKPGTSYCSYRPLLEVISKREVYVLKKTIKCEMGYYNDLPKNLMEFEMWHNALQNQFTSVLDNIDSYQLSTQIGEGFTLQKLRKKK